MEESNLSNYNRLENSPPTVRDFVAIVFRHRRLVALSFLGIFLGGILAAALQPNRYEAAMKILVKRDRVDPGTSSLPQLVTEEQLNSEVELLKSRDLLEKVVLACDLSHQNKSAWSRMFAALLGARGPQKVDPVAGAIRSLQKQLSVEVVKKTNLIAVTYGSPDPELAARVLTAMANLYLEKHVAVHRSPGAFDFFHEETQQFGKGLADAEARLVDFTHDESTVSAKLEKEVALQKLAEFDATLKQTQSAIAETKQRIHILQEQSTSIPPRMVTQVRNIDDATLLSHLRSSLLALELKRTELLGKFDPSYRPVQELEAEIAQTRAALKGAEKSQLREETTDRDPTHEWVTEEQAKAKADLAGLQARAEATALAVRSYRENARSLQQKEIVQGDLMRTVKATEENYLLYFRKAEEARISDALDSRRITNVAITEAATVPSLPSNRRSLTAMVGLFLAVLTSLGLAFGSDYLNTTFRTPDEVISFLNIPVLATMPQNGTDEKALEEGATPHVSRFL
jgi:uncharacterized protein involved in exopolysaccharide biosynthesis